MKVLGVALSERTQQQPNIPLPQKNKYFHLNLSLIGARIVFYVIFIKS